MYSRVLDYVVCKIGCWTICMVGYRTMYSRVLDYVWSGAGLCSMYNWALNYMYGRVLDYVVCTVGCWTICMVGYRTMYDRVLDYVVCTVGCWTMYGRVLDYVICKIGCWTICIAGYRTMYDWYVWKVGKLDIQFVKINIPAAIQISLFFLSYIFKLQTLPNKYIILPIQV